MKSGPYILTKTNEPTLPHIAAIESLYATKSSWAVGSPIYHSYAGEIVISTYNEERFHLTTGTPDYKDQTLRPGPARPPKTRYATALDEKHIRHVRNAGRQIDENEVLQLYA